MHISDSNYRMIQDLRFSESALPSKLFQVSITEWFPNRMQKLLCLRFPVTWSLQCCPDWTMWMHPSNHSQALWWLRVSLILLSNAMSWFFSRLLFVWVMDLAPSTQWLECLFVGEWHLLINPGSVCSQLWHHQVSWSGCLLAKFSPFEQFLIKFLDIRMFAFSFIVLQSRNWLTHNEPS